jgi:hypothetical protein
VFADKPIFNRQKELWTLAEQHTLEWSNVNFDRGQIELLEQQFASRFRVFGG